MTSATPATWEDLVAAAEEAAYAAAWWWDVVKDRRDCRTCGHVRPLAVCSAYHGPGAPQDISPRFGRYLDLAPLRARLPDSADDGGWPEGPLLTTELGTILVRGWPGRAAWHDRAATELGRGWLGCPRWTRR